MNLTRFHRSQLRTRLPFILNYYHTGLHSSKEKSFEHKRKFNFYDDGEEFYFKLVFPKKNEKGETPKPQPQLQEILDVFETQFLLRTDKSSTSVTISHKKLTESMSYIRRKDDDSELKYDLHSSRIKESLYVLWKTRYDTNYLPYFENNHKMYKTFKGFKVLDEKNGFSTYYSKNGGELRYKLTFSDEYINYALNSRQLQWYNAKTVCESSSKYARKAANLITQLSYTGGWFERNFDNIASDLWPEKKVSPSFINKFLEEHGEFLKTVTHAKSIESKNRIKDRVELDNQFKIVCDFRWKTHERTESSKIMKTMKIPQKYQRPIFHSLLDYFYDGEMVVQYIRFIKYFVGRYNNGMEKLQTNKKLRYILKLLNGANEGLLNKVYILFKSHHERYEVESELVDFLSTSSDKLLVKWMPNNDEQDIVNQVSFMDGIKVANNNVKEALRGVVIKRIIKHIGHFPFCALNKPYDYFYDQLLNHSNVLKEPQ